MRIVSLVPSATETLLALGVRPVACTRFCEQPGIPAVGGTKNPDIAAIVGLAPDLVIVNDEENRREDADALRAAGLRLHEMSPRSFDEVAPAVAALADAIGAEVPPSSRRSSSGGSSSGGSSSGAPKVPATALPVRRATVFVWRRPWMILTADTYGASLLACLGYEQTEVDGAAPGDRYPVVTLDAVAAAGPDVVVLPDEPFAFDERHRVEVAAAVPGAGVRCVDGRDLFWWGVRTPAALERLRAALG